MVLIPAHSWLGQLGLPDGQLLRHWPARSLQLCFCLRCMIGGVVMIGCGMILQIPVGGVEETLSTAASGQISQAEVQLRGSCMSGNTTCGLTGSLSLLRDLWPIRGSKWALQQHTNFSRKSSSTVWIQLTIPLNLDCIIHCSFCQKVKIESATNTVRDLFKPPNE